MSVDMEFFKKEFARFSRPGEVLAVEFYLNKEGKHIGTKYQCDKDDSFIHTCRGMWVTMYPGYTEDDIHTVIKA